MKQTNAETPSTAEKHFIELEVTLKGLDWESIRTEESAEQWQGYMKALGMNVSIVNEANNHGLVYEIDKALIKGETLVQSFRLQVQQPGTYAFSVLFSDCYGMNTAVSLKKLTAL